ncbi:flagellin [Aurantimonas sp. HBX-1]|uniref:flagellin N-terminal helical domain-containing protein n=1 Tax=Aurantimonas sp. HBX-1 TaxID=2906072 RepID=UPI001F1BF440|nr:flagellin [Aurantimonas sp. HBX-1]UIJ72873.1 flagellin C [Aurantimonas sp. HBX-1]
MTSINTNVAAMTALQTLQTTNKMMDETQNRISTGFRVSEAKDNAAYWSIATGMRSDNNAMSAVSDSLGIGAATVDAAYTGLSAAKDVLAEIKSKLTTATSDGVDRSKVQSEITALQEQLRTIADSSSFSGQNWLSTGVSTDLSKQIVSSLSRDANGKISIGSITVDITNIRLYSTNAAGTANTGILNKTIDLTKYTNTSGVAGTVEAGAGIDFAAANDLVSFSVKQGGSAARTVEITQATLTAAGLSDTVIRSNADLANVLTQALKDADIRGIEVSINAADNVVFSSTDTFTVSGATASGTSGLAVADLGLAATAVTTTTASAGATSVEAINITGATSTDIQNYIKVVDEALSQVTTAGASIGSVQNRVEMQTQFVSKLMDTIDKGVGILVDADMTEESTRLKALQTQQQLGVQALSIANSSSQAILQLFQN